MRWLADECISPDIVSNLRAIGHDVSSALETYRAKPDGFLLGIAVQENRILLTEDNDFGALIFRQALRYPVPGIVLMRIASERSREKWARLSEAISNHGEDLLGRYVVIGERRVRIRPLPRVT